MRRDQTPKVNLVDPDHCLKDGGVEGVRPREMQTHREDPIGMTRGREREKETIGISRIKIVEALHLALDRYPERLTPGAGVEEKATEAAVRVEIEIHQEILLDAVSHHCRDAEVESLPHAPVERRMMQRQVIAVAAHLGARDQDQERPVTVRIVLKPRKTTIRRKRAEDRNGMFLKTPHPVRRPQALRLPRAAWLVF